MPSGGTTALTGAHAGKETALKRKLLVDANAAGLDGTARSDRTPRHSAGRPVPTASSTALLARVVASGHWLGDWVLGARWLGRWYSERAVRFWRYSAGSVVAYLMSGAVFYAAVNWLDWGAITCTVVAFVAGAVPNWVLNRRWAWQRRGRDRFAQETSMYVVVTGLSLVLTAVATKLAAHWVDGMHASDIARNMLLTSTYMSAQVVMFVLKYVAYDRWVFVGRRTSRNHVLSTTAPNRRP
ncbi:MAG: GtrA family protein [Acidimicrobiales bacterium]